MNPNILPEIEYHEELNIATTSTKDTAPEVSSPNHNADEDLNIATTSSKNLASVDQCKVAESGYKHIHRVNKKSTLAGKPANLPIISHPFSQSDHVMVTRQGEFCSKSTERRQNTNSGKKTKTSHCTKRNPDLNKVTKLQEPASSRKRKLTETSHTLPNLENDGTIASKIQQEKEKKTQYQRKYLDNAKRKKMAQIHRNAQNELLSVEMKHAPSAEQLENAEKNPLSALMTLVTNTGLGRFPDTSHMINNWESAMILDANQCLPRYLSNMENEIVDNITEADKGRIVEEFQHSFNIEAPLFACANCGMKAFQMANDKSHAVPLHQLTALLMSDTDKETLNTIPSEFRMMASYYESPINGCFYHLHREFVESITSLNEEDVEHATLCHSCYEALTVDKKIPTFSLALGVDFGNADRIGLLKLTLAEEYVIATARLFISIIKLAGYQHAERQSGKLGHAIVFPQYGSKLEEEQPILHNLSQAFVLKKGLHSDTALS